MVRAVEVMALGLSLRQIYYRARRLGFDGEPGRPLCFTQAQVKAITTYKPARRGRKRK